MSWIPSHGRCDGIWLSGASPVTAELAASAGFAWALIDLEHGTASEAEAMAMLQLLSRSGTAAIVRLPAPSAPLSTRLLDAGAAGLMAPRVDDPATAAAFAARLRYAPHGVRGVAPLCRASGYGADWPAYRTGANTAVCAMVQIESAAGVAAADAIAAIDGVDVLFLGHADLATDLGCGDDVTAPAVAEAERTVVAACRRHGKRAGLLLRSGMTAARRHADGFDLIALGSDIACLRSGFDALRTTA